MPTGRKTSSSSFVYYLIANFHQDISYFSVIYKRYAEISVFGYQKMEHSGNTLLGKLEM